ncbi:ABC transporter substrate-binding protein [Kineococcus rubinsiae]|uniref:ABC transporter substrate-binding protein n=1 Tax=Kineococcus rubinsiae TaxID=2609562 RepID=UPI00142F50CA|nr:sugar ABC transporter substrate-binding protein [Kineococcus rubinsiae]NIZ89600.1 sugar ABC transporter substrate-binding protein [Kineococcus rubinsiae]
MRRRTFSTALIATAAVGSVPLASCSSDDSGSGDGAKTLKYWASNQGTSLDNDKEILTPELAKFEQQTGIKVELEVIPWDSLLQRILQATTSGDAPDVLNIGNTWSASLQATGAFLPFEADQYTAVGGKDKFLETSLGSTGAEGQPPTSVPLYGLAYGLFYSKKMFADAGITTPPATWADLVTDAKQLTDAAADRWGMTVAGASYTENAHFAFMFGKQNGAEFFDDAGKPTFTDSGNVKGLQQYLGLMSTDKVVSPSAAEHPTTNDMIADFTGGKAAMFMGQNNSEATILSNGMTAADYGVAPIPILDPLPSGGQRVNSHVAGINMSVFADSDNVDGALQFVKFMTSPEEQVILNQKFGSLPVVAEASSDAAFQTENLKIFNSVLSETAAPLPMIPNESQFETTVGQAMQDLFGRIATGTTPGDSDVEAALEGAQQKMAGGA